MIREEYNKSKNRKEQQKIDDLGGASFANDNEVFKNYSRYLVDDLWGVFI